MQKKFVQFYGIHNIPASVPLVKRSKNLSAMKKISLLISAISLSLCSLAQYNNKNLSIDEAAPAAANPKPSPNQYTHKNLRLYPVRANQEFLEHFKGVGKYTSMKKALEEKKVTVSEAVDSSRMISNSRRPNQDREQRAYTGESVNKLYVENTSSDTVLILAGEVVHGGKQDRMIAQNVLLPPKSGKMDISVFCVEHGRWTYGDGLATGGAVNFTTNRNASSNKMRKIAVVDKNQQKVWDEVENVTTKNDAKSESGTFRALNESKDYKESMDGYTKFFKEALKDQPNIIGVVACSGDSIIGCDLFATPDMFREQMDNLLQSYSTEAITNGKAANVSQAQAQAFLDKFLTDETKQEAEVMKSGAILKSNGRKLVMSKF